MRLSAAILVFATLSQMLSTEPIQASAASVVLVGAGDISSCDNSNDEATAKLLDNISGTVFTAGDNAYTDPRPRARRPPERHRGLSVPCRRRAAGGVSHLPPASDRRTRRAVFDRADRL